MNTRQAYAIRARVAIDLKEMCGYSFADISTILNLNSKEKARMLVARGRRNEREAWNRAVKVCMRDNEGVLPLSREVKPVKTPCRGKSGGKEGI